MESMGISLAECEKLPNMFTCKLDMVSTEACSPSHLSYESLLNFMFFLGLQRLERHRPSPSRVSQSEKAHEVARTTSIARIHNLEKDIFVQKT